MSTLRQLKSGVSRAWDTISEGWSELVERAYGSFERAIELPVPVSDSGVKAEYKRGVLRVTLPRRKDAKVRRIEVRRT